MADEFLQYINISPFYAGFDLEEKSVRTKFLRDYEILPIKLKEFLVSEITAARIEGLSQSYQLSANQITLLAIILRYVATGNLFIGDMPQELSRWLGIDQATAREVANQIVSQLFAPVLEDLNKVQAEKFPGRLAEKPVPQVPQVKPVEMPGQDPQYYQGQDLPESGGNIIDLRNMK